MKNHKRTNSGSNDVSSKHHKANDTLSTGSSDKKKKSKSSSSSSPKLLPSSKSTKTQKDDLEVTTESPKPTTEESQIKSDTSIKKQRTPKTSNSSKSQPSSEMQLKSSPGVSQPSLDNTQSVKSVASNPSELSNLTEKTPSSTNNSSKSTHTKPTPKESNTQQFKSPPINPKQVTLGIQTLIAHSKTKVQKAVDEGNMFADDVGSNEQFVSLVISLKRIPNKEKHKPVKIELQHPLFDPRLTPVCLIVKDPQQEYKELLAEKNIKFISKVVGIAKLKGKHSSFEARRQLLSSHGLFLTDARVLPILPGILGSKFFRSKKLPVPVNLTEPNKIKLELEQAISSTYLRLGTGSCVSIKIADLSRHNETEIQDNLQKVLSQLGKRIPLGGWTNVQGLHIKTGTSVSLPIWLADLDSSEFGRFAMEASQAEVDGKRGAEEKKRRAVEEKTQRKKPRVSA